MPTPKPKPPAAPEVVQARRAVCAECPHREAKKCGLCRCPIESKTLHQRAACPTGHW